MSQCAPLDKIETVARTIEFLVHLIDKDVRSPDAALDAACALAELFERDTIVGYTTIDSRGQVATFQSAVYPRLPTWRFSKVRNAPIRRPYVGTCAQAICEGRAIACRNIATETGFDPSWRQPAQNLASSRSSPLLYSGSTADPLAPLSRHRASHNTPSITT